MSKLNLKAALILGTCLGGLLPAVALAQTASIDLLTGSSLDVLPSTLLVSEPPVGPGTQWTRPSRLAANSDGIVTGSSRQSGNLSGVFQRFNSIVDQANGNSTVSTLVRAMQEEVSTDIRSTVSSPTDPKTEDFAPLIVPSGRELPTGGQVIFGGVSFDTATPDTLAIVQSTDKAITSWATFDIGAGYNVAIRQPNANSAMLARVRGDTPSLIAGKLTANGQVVLINPNGIAVGAGGRIDTGSFVASTLDIADADFLKGNLTFRRTGKAATVVNQGTINAATGIALVGSGVVNEGAVSARLGRIGYGAGDMLTVDFAGDQFLSIAIPVSDAAGITDILGRPLEALVQASGTSSAQGGQIYLSAQAARDLMLGAVKVDGDLVATTVREGSNGRISLGSVKIDGGGGLVQIEGKVDVSGGTGLNGGTIDIKSGAIGLGGFINASGDRNGGSVNVTASRVLSLAGEVGALGLHGTGGTLNYFSAGSISENVNGLNDASGGLSGGKITVTAAGDLATSGSYRANGLLGLGGRIDMTGSSVRLLSTTLSARGFQQGGLIRVGGAFQGGAATRTGRADYAAFEGRFGALPTLSNALTTFVNDGVTIDVSSGRGQGGSAIIWSDQTTTMLGALRASGLRAGGMAEVSGKETLRYVDLDRIDTGIGGTLLLDPKDIVIGDFAQLSSWQFAALIGQGGGAPGVHVADLVPGSRFGSAVALNAAGDRLAVGVGGNSSVLLFAFANNNFGGGKLVGTIGSGYVGPGNIDLGAGFDVAGLGQSVALNAVGDRLAVGAPKTSFYCCLTSEFITLQERIQSSDFGAVHLFTFADTSFGGGRLVGSIRAFKVGLPLGDRDINLRDTISTGFVFGTSVALNAAGDRLAVGATGDRGSLKMGDPGGSVRLFTFTDTSFRGGVLAGTIGSGFTGTKDVNLGTELNGFDLFGSSVALNAAGDRLAVGAVEDDGFGNSVFGSGSVRLFTFANTNFDGGSLTGTIGRGYTGVGSIDLGAALEARDYFGSSVALNAAGDRLVVGAPYDNGFGNVAEDSGAVRLFTFANTSFGGGTLVGTIGRGYRGSGDIDLGTALKASDLFGSSVALNAAGDRLAAGAEKGDSFGNSSPDLGSVRLFTFGNNSFGGGSLAGGMGENLALIGDTFNYLDLTLALGADSLVPQSVALNAAGNRLAVGASGDVGFGSVAGGIGTVRLFTFANDSFAGGKLVGTIGRGYTGGGNIDLGTALELGDRFGSSVALNAAGDRLAVGAKGDDGFGNVALDSGAVRLFTFANNSFGGGVLASTIGRGYAGFADLDLATALEPGDLFGGAVALNAAGNRLVVGAIGDDGFGNVKLNVGSVRLFSFDNNGFGNGRLAGTIGRGYVGAGDLNLGTLVDQGYEFGKSVALNAAGDRLAIGLEGNFGNFLSPTAENYIRSQNPAVRLFTFSNTDFGGGTLAGLVGTTFPDENNVVRFQTNARFADSVALNAVGDVLAVGAPLSRDPGRVWLFGFDNNSFGGGALTGSIGSRPIVFGDFRGLNDFDTKLSPGYSGVYLGSSVALDASGTRMALGGGDVLGQNVLLLTKPISNDIRFGENPSGTSNISVTALARALSGSRGNVVLEASNDITLNSNLVAGGGTLTLQAGRSILLNANINRFDSDLILIANSGGSNLTAVNANRSPGAAEIRMAPGTSISAATNTSGLPGGFSGNVTITLMDGAGLTTPTSGDITLGSISAGRIRVTNAGLTPGSDIILSAGSVLTSPGAGYVIDLRALNGSFTNLAGAGAFNMTYFGGFGRYKVYSDAPDTTTEGVTGYLKRYNVADEAKFASLFITVNFGPNFFAYRAAPILTVAAANNTRIYGNANPALTANITGFIDGDTAAGSLTGAANISTTAGVISAVGNYAITSALGTLASAEGYRFAFTNGTLAITPRPLTVTANALSRIFGDANPALTYTVGGQGLVNGDALSGALATTANATSNVGNYAITQGTVAASSNYALVYTGASLNVTPRSIGVQADSLRRRFGLPDPTFTYSISSGSLINGDNLTGALTRVPGEFVGPYNITQGSLGNPNYQIAYQEGVLNIDPGISNLPLGSQSVGNSSGSSFDAASNVADVNTTNSGISEIINSATKDNDDPPTLGNGCMESAGGVCVVTGS
jgi:filamentous hemagglutinin family protein